MSIEAGLSSNWLDASSRRLQQRMSFRETPVTLVRPAVSEVAPQPAPIETTQQAIGEVVVFSRDMLGDRSPRPIRGMSIPQIQRELASIAVSAQPLAKAA